MRATARVVAEANGRGGTRLTVLRGESPLLLRRTGPDGGAGLTVHLVGGAAGPLRGDDLSLRIEVDPAARLDIRSVAASLALPGPPGRPASRLRIEARVAAGATLRWLPEPLIAAAGCDHRAVTVVEAEAGATVVWRDDLVCGRHGEPCGQVRTDVLVRYAGATLYRHELAVGADAPGWSGPAVLGSSGTGGAYGSVLLAGPPVTATAAPAGPAASPAHGTAVIMDLAGPGRLATAVGADIRAVRAALDPLCERLGEPPEPQRDQAMATA
ncbi:urease accessory protein UreD [Mangrovihabitans endophyticus]|uniref:Urease accessory protein UreD n=1 Tax=Mangrovihabitans endophyticus TaxID=1751298 RepID=A0A8J3BZD3_9ACTN|nr:urease accessory protein UreD [Mangrovihabitans endophyticus]GGK85810.1 urease accessory protein UreD [Mangrovihabitans endophyticus]